MSEPTSTWPIATELPSELAFLANHISTYFNSNPPYNQATLGALIFTPPPQTPRLLLVQVTETGDPDTFSWAWEVPSGAPKSSDLTLLHALSRIVLEQTGLHLSRVHTMSGSQIGPQDENPQWIKLQFTCQVRELDCDNDRFYPQQTLAYQMGNPESYNFEAAKAQAKDPNTVPVRLNSQSHRQHAWATEEDLREFMNLGLYPNGANNQYQSMLDAFALYKQDYLDVSRSKAPASEPPAPSPPAPNPAASKSPAPSSKGASKRDSPVQAARAPSKLTKGSSKRSSSSKSKPDSSHFHRFRIS